MRIGLALFTLCAAPSTAMAQVSLTFGGTCPDALDIDVTGLTPQAQFAVLSADAPGPDGVVPAGPCLGTPTGLDAASQQLVAIRPTQNGSLTIVDKAVNAGLCGKAIALVDAASCQVSNVAIIPSAQPPCTTWLAEYDLTGSQLFIDALVDFTITLQQPYGDDLNMGPGRVRLRFADGGGAPGDGPATVIDYQMTQNFLTGVPGLADVTTDLENTAADTCGVALGDLFGPAMSWTPPEIDPYCQTGTVSCVGPFCGLNGAPPENDPIVYDNACSALPIDTFTFAPDLSGFTMPFTVIDSDGNQTTSLALTGTLVQMIEDTNTPPCSCP